MLQPLTAGQYKVKDSSSFVVNGQLLDQIIDDVAMGSISRAIVGQQINF